MEYQEGGKNNTKSKNSTINFLFPEFSKLCLIIEANITALFDVTLNVCRGNIEENYFINEGE